MQIWHIAICFSFHLHFGTFSARVCILAGEKSAKFGKKKSKIKIPEFELNVLRVDTVSLDACNFIKFTIDANNYTEDGSSRYL